MNFLEDLLTKRWVSILAIVLIVVGFSGVLLLLVYYPKSTTNQNGVDLINQIANIDQLQIQNQVATTDSAVLSLIKEISGGNIEVIKITKDETKSWIYQVKGFISIGSGYDNWVKIQAPQMSQIELFGDAKTKLNLPKTIDFDTTNLPKSYNTGLDYNYLFDTQNLIQATVKISTFLSQLDQGNSSKYQSNAQNIISKSQNIKNPKPCQNPSKNPKILIVGEGLQYLFVGFDASYISGFDPNNYDEKQSKLLLSISKNLGVNKFYSTIPTSDETAKNIKKNLGLDIVYLDAFKDLTKSKENQNKKITEILSKNIEIKNLICQ